VTETIPFEEQAGRRSQGYWLLSRLFLELPTPARLAELHDALAGVENDSGLLRDDVAFLRDAVREAMTVPGAMAAAVEYTRRFVATPQGSHEPLPFESHVREGCLPGEATGNVRALAAEWGYGDVAPESGSPDHLGAELRLMALLCHDERTAWRTGGPALAIESLRRQSRFLEDHLVPWAPDYCTALAARAGNSYVQAIARITASTLRADVTALDEISRQVDAMRADTPTPDIIYQ
jgi:TorA maturation chaperone TorD